MRIAFFGKHEHKEEFLALARQLAFLFPPAVKKRVKAIYINKLQHRKLLEFGLAGQYAKGTIFVSKFALGNAEDFAETLLHEAGHALGEYFGEHPKIAREFLDAYMDISGASVYYKPPGRKARKGISPEVRRRDAYPAQFLANYFKDFLLFPKELERHERALPEKERRAYAEVRRIFSSEIFRGSGAKLSKAARERLRL